MLACVLIGNDDDQLGDLAANHPLVQLGHDLFYVGADLVVGRDKHIEAIFLDGAEVFCWVNATLEEDGMNRILELRSREAVSNRRLQGLGNAGLTYKLGYKLCAAFERKLVCLRL